MNTLVHADPRLRKRAIVVALMTALVGIVYLYWLNGFLDNVEILSVTDWEAAVEKLWPILLVTMAAVLCSAVAVAGILAYLAVRVYHTGQYPPPGIRVIWNTPLRTGRAATVAATCILLLAVATIVYGALMIHILWRAPDVHLASPIQAKVFFTKRSTLVTVATQFSANC